MLQCEPKMQIWSTIQNTIRSIWVLPNVSATEQDNSSANRESLLERLVKSLFKQEAHRSDLKLINSNPISSAVCSVWFSPPCWNQSHIEIVTQMDHGFVLPKKAAFSLYNCNHNQVTFDHALTTFASRATSYIPAQKAKRKRRLQLLKG